MLIYGVARTYQPITPTTGTTVNLDPNTNDVILVLTPATSLASLEVDFPPDPDTILGQEVRISTTKAITNFTMGGAVNILNPPNTLQANDMFSMTKTAADTWVRLGTV